MSSNTKHFYIDLLASGFYSGKARSAPGTCGTAAAMLLVLIGASIFPSAWYPFYGATLPVVLTIAALTIAAIYISERALQLKLYDSRNKDSENKDPKQIVIDEFVGYFAAIAFVPPTLNNLLLAFVLFRVFDIAKPPPVRTVERIGGGAGIVLDDTVAGIFANICLQILLYFFN